MKNKKSLFELFSENSKPIKLSSIHGGYETHEETQKAYTTFGEGGSTRDWGPDVRPDAQE